MVECDMCIIFYICGESHSDDQGHGELNCWWTRSSITNHDRLSNPMKIKMVASKNPVQTANKIVQMVLEDVLLGVPSTSAELKATRPLSMALVRRRECIHNEKPKNET